MFTETKLFIMSNYPMYYVIDQNENARLVYSLPVEEYDLYLQKAKNNPSIPYVVHRHKKSRCLVILKTPDDVELV